ncbi:hypothetical protein IWW39_006339, partial [Coemansia spiralis]
MHAQTPPATEADMPPGTTETPESSLHGLSREKVREVIMEVQALRLRGATEQNSKDLARLMDFLRSLTDNRAQAQLPPPATVVSSDADHHNLQATIPM